MKVLPKPFRCIVKLLRRSVKNPLLRYSLKKMVGKQNERGEKSL
jgi:hypothetical protein